MPAALTLTPSRREREHRLALFTWRLGLAGKWAKAPVTINTVDVANHRRLIGRNGLLHTLFKGRHNLCCEPLPLLQHHGMRGTDWVTHGDAIESRVTLLQLHQLLDHKLRW